MKLFGQFVASCGIYMLATCILPMAVADDKIIVVRGESEPVKPPVKPPIKPPIKEKVTEKPIKGDTNVASRDNVHIDLHIDSDLCHGPRHRYPYGIPDKYDWGYYGDWWGRDYKYGKHYGGYGFRGDVHNPYFGGYPYYTDPYYTEYKNTKPNYWQ